MHLVDADILFLQEVVGENLKKANSVSNWEPESQFEFLADSLWPHHAYGKNSVYNHGHHGNAILSRHPLGEQTNIDLSLIPYSRRGVLHTRILGNLELFCVHFGLFSLERRSQMKKLISIIHQHINEDSPIIIAGDFNDWRNHLGHFLQQELNMNEALLSSYGHPQPTFPAKAPMLSMDRIYYRGLNLVEAKVLKGNPWNKLSDHCAVYAEFSTLI